MKNEHKVLAYKLSLWIGIPITLIGSFLRINHNLLGDWLLVVGGNGALLIFILGMIDVLSANTTKSTKTAEKTMWICGFLFFAYLTGLVYLKNYKQHHID